MMKDSPANMEGRPLSLNTHQQSTGRDPYKHSGDRRGNSSSCGRSPFHKDHQWDIERLQEELEAERLCFKEAQRRFTIETQELREAAKRDRQLLEDQLRSKWEQKMARELHQLKEANERQRKAEIRQLLRWKEAELHESQEHLLRERNAAMWQARDLQRQLAKELVSHRGRSHGAGGEASGGGLSAEFHGKLEQVLGKLRWEVDGEQAARIRHLEAELELERSLFLKYILERFEGEPFPAGFPQRFREASLPQHLGRARPHSSDSHTAGVTPDVSKSCSLVNHLTRCECPCHYPQLEEGSAMESSCPGQPHVQPSGKELQVEKEPKKEVSVDSPPEGKVNSLGAAGEHAQEGLPQQGWLPGNSYGQLLKQNTDLSNALKVLEQRCIHLQEDNTLLRKSSFPVLQDKSKQLKRKAAELAILSKRLEEAARKLEKSHLGLSDTPPPLATISEEDSQLYEEKKWAEQIETENTDLKVKLRQATEERNAAVQLTKGLEVKVEDLEHLVKGMKERAERREELESEHEKTLLELQKKEEEMQQLQQAQREIKREHEGKVQFLEIRVKELGNLYHSQTEHFNLLSQELERLQTEKCPKTCSSTGMNCPAKWGQDPSHALHRGSNTHDEDNASVASDCIRKAKGQESCSNSPGAGAMQTSSKPCLNLEGKTTGALEEWKTDIVSLQLQLDPQRPFRLRVFLARYSYDPFHGPNENPEMELPLTAGEYVYICGEMDEDGFYVGELMDGRRGFVPSNLVEEVAGNNLLSFIPSDLSGISSNSFLEPNFSCQSACCQEKGNCPDEDIWVNLPSDGPGGTLGEVQAAMPSPPNMTLILNLQNITATSAEITWLLSNSHCTHIVYLNEEKYDVTQAGVSWYTFASLRPSTPYSVRVEPLVPTLGQLEPKTADMTFTTPSAAAGPPDAPLDVQVQAGSSADILVVSWLPVTIHPSGSSNGVQVTGYAIYISGQKVKAIMSPTAGSVSVEVSQINKFQGPWTVSVRTISPFGESADSLPALIPSNLHFTVQVGSSGLTFKELFEPEGRPIPATEDAVEKRPENYRRI